MNPFNEPKINLNTNGKEYVEYLQYQKSLKKKLSKNQMIGIYCLAFSVCAAIFVGILIKIFFFPTPEYVSSVPTFMAMTWNDLIKRGLIVAFPFIIVAWVIHGVQLRLLA